MLRLAGDQTTSKSTRISFGKRQIIWQQWTKGYNGIINIGTTGTMFDTTNNSKVQVNLTAKKKQTTCTIFSQKTSTQLIGPSLICGVIISMVSVTHLTLGVSKTSTIMGIDRDTTLFPMLTESINGAHKLTSGKCSKTIYSVVELVGGMKHTTMKQSEMPLFHGLNNLNTLLLKLWQLTQT